MNRKGFGVLMLILVVAAVLVVGGGVWYYTHNSSAVQTNNNKDLSSSTSSTTASSSTGSVSNVATSGTSNSLSIADTNAIEANLAGFATAAANGNAAAARQFVVAQDVSLVSNSSPQGGDAQSSKDFLGAIPSGIFKQDGKYTVIIVTFDGVSLGYAFRQENGSWKLSLTETQRILNQ